MELEKATRSSQLLVLMSFHVTPYSSVLYVLAYFNQHIIWQQPTAQPCATLCFGPPLLASSLGSPNLGRTHAAWPSRLNESPFEAVETTGPGAKKNEIENPNRPRPSVSLKANSPSQVAARPGYSLPVLANTSVSRI